MSWELVLATVGLVLGALGAVGVGFGQLRRGVVSELRSALASAQVEINIEHGRSDRLESEAVLLRAEVNSLRVEVTALRMVRIDEVKLAASIALALSKETETIAERVALRLDARAAKLAAKVEATAAEVAEKLDEEAAKVAAKVLASAAKVRKDNHGGKPL